MSDSNIIIPPEFIELIDERERIQQEYQESDKLTAKLDELSHQVPNSSITPIPPQQPLTREQTPRAELALVLRLLEESLAYITRIEEQIRRITGEIQQSMQPVPSESQSGNGIIIAIIVALVIIVLLFVLLHH